MESQNPKSPNIGSTKPQPDLSDASRANRSLPSSPPQQQAKSIVNNTDNHADTKSDAPKLNKPKVCQNKPGPMVCDLKTLFINNAVIAWEIMAIRRSPKQWKNDFSAKSPNIVNNIDNKAEPVPDPSKLTPLKADHKKPGLMFCDIKTLLVINADIPKDIVATRRHQKLRKDGPSAKASNTVNNIDDHADTMSHLPRLNKPKVVQNKPGPMFCDLKTLFINNAVIAWESVAIRRSPKQWKDDLSAKLSNIVNNIDKCSSLHEADYKPHVKIPDELKHDQNKPGPMACDLKTIFINKAVIAWEIVANRSFTKLQQ